MIYEELVKEIQEIFEKADVSQVKEQIAYQFNIEGEAEGAFYVMVSEGRLQIEPFEYYDRDVLFTTSAHTLLEIAKGKLDAVAAFTIGKLKVEGDFDKALLLQQFSREQKKLEKKQEKEAKQENKESKTESKTEKSCDAVQLELEISETEKMPVCEAAEKVSENIPEKKPIPPKKNVQSKKPAKKSGKKSGR